MPAWICSWIKLENGLIGPPWAVGTADAPPARFRSSMGKNSGNNTGPVACNIACLSVLCSSRTFPGHEYPTRRSIASEETSHKVLPSSRPKRARKCSTRSRNIAATLAEWRQGDRKSIKAVVEIGAELTAGDHRFQIAVRGGDDPYVALDGFVASHALEPLVLEHAQDLALHQRRHVADFIEEQGAAVALLELANPPGRRPCKRSLLVPEKLAFQEALRDGGAD